MYKDDNIEPEFMKRPKENPFRTPDHYFDSIEDRVMDAIKKDELKRKTTFGSGKTFRLLKPVMGIAASLTILYLLAYYPIKYFSPKSNIISEATDTTSTDVIDEYTLNLSLIDDNSLANAIFDDEISNTEKMNQEEVLAYLSTEMTDLEIYNEMQN
jgi:hypothetical protein